MPTARRIATPTNSASTAQQHAGADLAGLERRQHDVVGGPAEHPGVGDGQRAEQHAAERREREDPRLALDRDPEDGEPGTPSCPAAVRSSVTCASPDLRGTRGSPGIPTLRHRDDRRRDRRMLRAMTDSSPRPRERHELCDLALALGPDAPTLCGGWDAHDLLVAPGRPRAQAARARWATSSPRCPASPTGRWRKQRQSRSRCWSSSCASPALYLRAMPVGRRGDERLEYSCTTRTCAAAGPAGSRASSPPTDARRALGPARQGHARSSAASCRSRPCSGAPTPARPRVRRRATTRSSSPAPVVELVLFLFGRSAVRGLTFDGPDDAVASCRARPSLERLTGARPHGCAGELEAALCASCDRECSAALELRGRHRADLSRRRPDAAPASPLERPWSSRLRPSRRDHPDVLSGSRRRTLPPSRRYCQQHATRPRPARESSMLVTSAPRRPATHAARGRARTASDP